QVLEHHALLRATGLREARDPYHLPPLHPLHRLAVLLERQRDRVLALAALAVPLETQRAVRQRQPEQHQRGIRRPGKGRETRDHRELPRTGNQPELTVTVQRPPERRSAIRPRLPRAATATAHEQLGHEPQTQKATESVAPRAHCTCRQCDHPAAEPTLIWWRESINFCADSSMSMTSWSTFDTK